MVIIYCVTNTINSKQYVGQTCMSIEKRLYFHNREVKYGSKNVFHKAIRKYGLDNFDIDIICECDDKEANRLEIDKIKELNSMIPNGYNMVEGGNKPPIGRKKSSFKKGQIPWNKGKKCPETYGGNNPNAKAIILIHPDGKEEKFECMMGACRKYNLSSGTLSSVVNKRKYFKTYKGFKVRYV